MLVALRKLVRGTRFAHMTLIINASHCAALCPVCVRCVGWWMGWGGVGWAGIVLFFLPLFSGPCAFQCRRADMDVLRFGGPPIKSKCCTQ